MTSEREWWAPEVEEPDPHPMFSAARLYLAWGWYPIPVAQATKMPTLPNWPETAKAMNYEKVEAIWDRPDPPSIGLVTGLVFDVLDVDGKEGRESLRKYLNGRPFAPTGPMSVTGGGGRHLLFRSTGHGNRSNLLPSVDFRGARGQVIAPPSIHTSGNPYVWSQRNPADMRLPDAPDWLIDLLEQTKRLEQVLGNKTDNGSVTAALDAAGIPYRHRGDRSVFQCQTGRHRDSEWSCSTGLGEVPDRKWSCFGCTAWGDAENITSETHVFNGRRCHNGNFAA